MGLFSAIGNFFKGIFGKVSDFVKKAWQLATPFLQEVLSKTAQNVWNASKDLFIAAVQFVAEQGFPTDDEKRRAFRYYMETNSHDVIAKLSDSELNLLREMALAIFKKASGQ